MDEIGDHREVAAIQDIAQRGVAVVATAHGTSLKQLLESPVLNSLVGGKQKVVVGDETARWAQATSVLMTAISPLRILSIDRLEYSCIGHLDEAAAMLHMLSSRHLLHVEPDMGQCFV